MRIFRWWKRVDLAPGVSALLFPVQEINEDQAFFELTIEHIREKTNFDYHLTEEYEKVLEYRGNKEDKD